MLLALAIAARAVKAAWIWAALNQRLGAGSPVAHRLFRELRPLFWPLVAVELALRWAHHGELPLELLPVLVLDPLARLWLRNAGGEDGRWTRRARAFGQRVVRSVHRLRVVPAPAGAGA